MNRKYHPQTEEYIKQHYPTMSNAELAAELGITSAQVLYLARRLRVKWRAENGCARWRASKHTNHTQRQAA